MSNKNIFKLLYIFSLVICFSGNNSIQIFISFCWIVYTLVCMGFRRKKIYGYGEKYNEYKFWLKIFFIPQVLIHLYTVFLILIGNTESNILSTNLVTYSSILLSIFSVYLFGQSALKMDFIAIIITWILFIIKRIGNYGLSSFYQSILVGWFRADGVNPFEFDDIILVTGYLWVIMFFMTKDEIKKTKLIRVLIFLAFFFGAKRIGILAVICITLFYLFLIKSKKIDSYKLCLYFGFAWVIMSIIYIYILSSGSIFYDWISKHNINTMSRTYFYDYIMSLTEFSPSFLGYGRGSVKYYMFNKFVNYINVHSDYIKMYFEIGFIPYILWLLYYLYYCQVRIKRRYNSDVAVFYFTIILYTFMLYITDNTESYYICTLIRTTAPIVYSLNYYKLKNKNNI